LTSEDNEAKRQPRVSVATALGQFANRQLAVLAATLDSLLEGEDAEAIHDLRVSTRRLQALLGVLATFPGGEAIRPLRRALRRLRSVLGEWRNCDVSLEAIAERRARAESPAETASWERIEADLRRGRADALAEGRQRIRRTIDKNLVGTITRAVEERLSAIRPSALRRAVDEQIEKAWSRWTACLQSAEQDPTVERIHALRIATKRVRYAAELARDLARARTEAVLHWARAAQKSLGDWHDKEILHRAIAEAVARPDLALEDPDATLAVLTILARERREAAPRDRNLVALALPEEALGAARKWRRPVRVNPQQP
jgi:CHAD domain-containing protein